MPAIEAKKKDHGSPDIYLLLRNNCSPSANEEKVTSKSKKYYNKGSKKNQVWNLMKIRWKPTEFAELWITSPTCSVTNERLCLLNQHGNSAALSARSGLGQAAGLLCVPIQKCRKEVQWHIQHKPPILDKLCTWMRILPSGERWLSAKRWCLKDKPEDAVWQLLEFSDNLKMTKWPKCSRQATEFLKLLMKSCFYLISSNEMPYKYRRKQPPLCRNSIQASSQRQKMVKGRWIEITFYFLHGLTTNFPRGKVRKDVYWWL